MTKCEIKRWSLGSTDIQTITQEIEKFLNLQEVVALETLIFQGQLTLIVIFKTDKDREA